LDATDLDAALLEAAALRAYRRLSSHWLHALRGTLNATSLNLVLLNSSGVGPVDGGKRALDTLRNQVRELDKALTQLLDLEWLEEAPAGRAELAVVLSRAWAMVDPCARRKQIHIDSGVPVPGPWVGMDPAVLYTVFLFLMTDTVTYLAPRTPLAVWLTPSSSGKLEVSLTAPRENGGVETREAAAFDATRRLIQRHGGDLRRDLAPERELVTLILPAARVGGGAS
jgi:signal transduction histidine kinase